MSFLYPHSCNPHGREAPAGSPATVRTRPGTGCWQPAPGSVMFHQSQPFPVRLSRNGHVSNSATETLAKCPRAGLGRPGHLVKRDIEENPPILLLCGHWVSVYAWIPGNHLMAVRITSLRYRLRGFTTSGNVLSPNVLLSGILDFPSSRHFSHVVYRCG